MKDVSTEIEILENQHVTVESPGVSMDTDAPYKKPFRSEQREIRSDQIRMVRVLGSHSL
jgi:hypothetical protein